MNKLKCSVRCDSVRGKMIQCPFDVVIEFKLEDGDNIALCERCRHNALHGHYGEELQKALENAR